MSLGRQYIFQIKLLFLDSYLMLLRWCVMNDMGIIHVNMYNCYHNTDTAQVYGGCFQPLQ